MYFWFLDLDLGLNVALKAILVSFDCFTKGKIEDVFYDLWDLLETLRMLNHFLTWGLMRENAFILSQLCTMIIFTRIDFKH